MATFRLTKDLFQGVDDSELTADLVDMRIRMLSPNFIEKTSKNRLYYILNISLNKFFFDILKSVCDEKVYIKDKNIIILIFYQNHDSGYLFLYSYKLNNEEVDVEKGFCVIYRDYECFCSILRNGSYKFVFDLWRDNLDKILKLPTEFVNGRIGNTDTEKSHIYLKGYGCIVCGNGADFFAATTFSGLMVKMLVCKNHIGLAKQHGSAINFLFSQFGMQENIVTCDQNEIPEEYIKMVFDFVSAEVSGIVESIENRSNGWTVKVKLTSGWKWIFRVKNFLDYGYMLQDENKNDIYRADSANHHRELNFPPDHQHEDIKNKTTPTPSFLFGFPAFDIKLIKRVSSDYGAI